MNQEHLLFVPIPKHELINEILTGVKDLLATRDTPDSPPDDIQYLDGAEVNKLLKITNATRYQWEKQGILKGYRIGTRRRYLRSEVLEAIKKVDSNI